MHQCARCNANTPRLYYVLFVHTVPMRASMRSLQCNTGRTPPLTSYGLTRALSTGAVCGLGNPLVALKN
eukprot:3180785-Rhodomonas_salina.3